MLTLIQVHERRFTHYNNNLRIFKNNIRTPTTTYVHQQQHTYTNNNLRTPTTTYVHQQQLTYIYNNLRIFKKFTYSYNNSRTPTTHMRLNFSTSFSLGSTLNCLVSVGLTSDALHGFLPLLSLLPPPSLSFFLRGVAANTFMAVYKG